MVFFLPYFMLSRLWRGVDVFLLSWFCLYILIMEQHLLQEGVVSDVYAEWDKGVHQLEFSEFIVRPACAVSGSAASVSRWRGHVDPVGHVWASSFCRIGRGMSLVFFFFCLLSSACRFPVCFPLFWHCSI